MYRLRISLPKGQTARYRHLDLLHDALINAWTTVGAPAEQVLGASARPWNFAALGWHRGDWNEVHTLVVSTPDPDLATRLHTLEPGHIRQARASTAELVDFSAARMTPEPDPIPPGEGILSLLMLAPLAVSIRAKGEKRWHTDLTRLDLAAVINHRLSQLAGRSVALQAQADTLYLRANPVHATRVYIKQLPDGRRVFVMGMRAPLVLAGTEDDLRLAWYAGIGEKTRNGFGCLGLLEQGVGR